MMDFVFKMLILMQISRWKSGARVEVVIPVHAKLVGSNNATTTEEGKSERMTGDQLYSNRWILY